MTLSIPIRLIHQDSLFRARNEPQVPSSWVAQRGNRFERRAELCFDGDIFEFEASDCDDKMRLPNVALWTYHVCWFEMSCRWVDNDNWRIGARIT